MTMSDYISRIDYRGVRSPLTEVSSSQLHQWS
jgi:hypothetical protein